MPDLLFLNYILSITNVCERIKRAGIHIDLFIFCIFIGNTLASSTPRKQQAHTMKLSFILSIAAMISVALAQEQPERDTIAKPH